MEAKYSIELKFKNMEDEMVDVVEYVFDSNGGHLSGKGNLSKDGLHTVEGTTTLNGATPAKVKLTIHWNGKTEIIHLMK